MHILQWTWIAALCVLPVALAEEKVTSPKLNTTLYTIKQKEDEVLKDPSDYSKIGDYLVCGNSSRKDIHSKGENPKQRDFPWMAVFIEKEHKKHFYGGAVITQRHILTAAHGLWFAEPGKFVIRLGDFNLNVSSDSQHIDMEVKEIRIHEDYDTINTENDIAIVVLEKPIEYSQNVQPLCLPLPDDDYTNQTGLVAGWGAIRYKGPQSQVLMTVAVPIWDQQTCDDSVTQIIPNTTLCASNPSGGQDACQGDSGSPMVRPRKDGRWEAIGIVSWGIGCGGKGKPGIYTRVNRYLDWIASHIKDY